jgi:quercetin dioxygenase-like cupin family protein
MHVPSLPARNLEPAELRGLVEAVAAEAETWRQRVDVHVGQRHFESLYRDDYVDIWVISWAPEGDTGWHDHDISSGAVHVIEGALRESHPRLGGQAAERVVSAGSSFCFGSEHIHRLSGHAEHSVSIHAYSPPLWRLGQYSVDADGVMRRISVSYADELRPLDASVAA